MQLRKKKNGPGVIDRTEDYTYIPKDERDNEQRKELGTYHTLIYVCTTYLSALLERSKGAPTPDEVGGGGVAKLSLRSGRIAKYRTIVA